MERIEVKKEEETRCSTSSLILPGPREGLNDNCPPPFLTKTFDMVEDPATNSVISWSEARNSFIIWNLHAFSTNLLPRYFKHSNFSSFIRQLNTYGFRKIDPNRWEFANEGFLGGQRHLLKTIKRRRNVPQSFHRQQFAPCIELGKYEFELEIDRLKRDRNVLMTEILKLRHQQNTSKTLLSSLQDRLQGTESKQQHMMNFLARALNNPFFVQQLIAQRENNKIIENSGQKRRLTDYETTEDLQIRETQLLGGSSYAHEELKKDAELENLLRVMENDPSFLEISRDVMWEEFVNEDWIQDDDKGDVERKSCWSDDVEISTDQTGYLGGNQ